MPHYDLEEVRSVATDLAKVMLSRKANTDRTELSYEMQDVQDCLLKLSTSGFYKTYDYNGRMMDAYHVEHSIDGNHTDRLYVKFGLTETGMLMLHVCSFHLDR